MLTISMIEAEGEHLLEEEEDTVNLLLVLGHWYSLPCTS